MSTSPQIFFFDFFVEEPTLLTNTKILICWCKKKDHQEGPRTAENKKSRLCQKYLISFPSWLNFKLSLKGNKSNSMRSNMRVDQEW